MLKVRSGPTANSTSMTTAPNVRQEGSAPPNAKAADLPATLLEDDGGEKDEKDDDKNEEMGEQVAWPSLRNAT